MAMVETFLIIINHFLPKYQQDIILQNSQFQEQEQDSEQDSPQVVKTLDLVEVQVTYIMDQTE